MNILIFSVVFAPSIGGVETVSSELAEGLTALGCEVVVVTQTGEDDDVLRPYQLVRRPTTPQLLRLVRWSDVVFHNSINLRAAWPLVVARRPWVIAHHMWLPRTGKDAFAGYAKRLALKLASRNVVVSSAMAQDIKSSTIVIPNPYNSTRFRLLPNITRENAIVFVGRLVSDKGVALLIEALDHLKREGHHPRLKIIGSGKEDGTLRALVARLGLQSQVSFLGAQTGEVLVELLNAHSVIAIPSVWREPFGLVALEGLACGCIPVAADGGGLQEAIGECGLTFSRGSSKALAEALGCALYNPYIGERVRMRSTAHLARHERGSIALRYHEIFSQAIAQQSTKTAMATRR